MRSMRWILLILAGIFLVVILKTVFFPSDGSMVWKDVKSEEELDDFIDQMTAEEKVGQLLMPAIREFDGKPVTEMNKELKSMLDTYQPGGIILFRENVQSRKQVKLLNEDLQKESELPLLLSIDQEGGLVTRLTYFPELTGNMALGATGDRELAKETGVVLGAELKQLGIHIDFAPSVDVNTNPHNPVIGIRSYGDDTRLVSEMGVSFMNGLEKAGVMAVAKHFPGHGGLALDSHYVLPVGEQTLEDLKQTELVPFQKMINEGVSGVMTAHITFPKIDKSELISKKDGLPIQVPATISKKIINDVLREDMNFDGLVFTDSMEMKAIADHFGPGEAAVKAVLAGVDIICMPDHLKVAYDSLLEAVEEKRISEKRLDKSVKRILQAKMKWVDESEKVLDTTVTQKALDLEKKVAEQSITLLENTKGIVPLEESFDGTITLISTNSQNLEAMKNALWKHHKKFKIVPLNSNTLTPEQKKAIQDGDMTIVITESTTVLGDSSESSAEKSILQEAINNSDQSILVMARNPYDGTVLSDVDAVVAQYTDHHTSFQATADVLFGKIKAAGELPVKLQDVE